MEINSVIVIWICLSEFLEIQNPVICRWMGVKMEVKWFVHEFGLEIFFLYHEINNFEIKFRVKKNVSGELFTRRYCLENALKSDLRSPFQQQLLNG